MRRFTKITALLLAILMLLMSLAGCGEAPDTDPAATTTTGASVTTSGEDGETEATWEPLPQIDWDGRVFRVMGQDGVSVPQYYNMEIAADTLNGEVVNDAVYARNETLRTRYNFRVKADLYDTNSYQGMVTSAFGSGEERWELVLFHTYFAQRNAQKGMLIDLNTVKYVNFDAPCWNDYANEQLSIAGRLYFTSNDFNLVDKNRVYMLIYNRGIARANKDIGIEIETLVDSNEWTLEKLYQFTKAAAADSDGYSGMTINDTYGLSIAGELGLGIFALGFNSRPSKLDENGNIVLCGLDNNATFKWDKIIELCCDRNITWSNDYGQDGDGSAMFMDNRVLFNHGVLSFFDTSLKNIDFEYGFLPMPKYDPSQDHYYAPPCPNSNQVLAIPYSCTDTEFAGFALEAVSEESTATSLHAFYEVKCKLRESYDQRCADMLDLIFENVVYDVVYLGNIGGMQSDVYSMVGRYGFNCFDRLYQKKVSAIELELERIVNEYKS